MAAVGCVAEFGRELAVQREGGAGLIEPGGHLDAGQPQARSCGEDGEGRHRELTAAQSLQAGFDDLRSGQTLLRTHAY